MIRWLTRTPADQLTLHARLAQLGPAALKAYNENAVFWRELAADRSVFPLCAAVMGLAVLGGTGMGAAAATEAWPWAALLALAAAAAAVLIAHPHDSTGAFRPGTEGPIRPRGIWVAVLALVYLLPLAIQMYRSSPESLPQLAAVAVGFVQLGLCGLWKPTRWLAGCLLALLAPSGALWLIWQQVPPAEISPVSLGLFAAGGLGVVLALRAPSGFGLWPPSVLAGELAFLALWLEVMAGAGTRADGLHLTWGFGLAAVFGLGALGMAEGMASGVSAGALFGAVPAIHLLGLCTVPPEATGTLGAHLAIATGELALILALLQARLAAWRTAEFAPRVVRQATVVVARLDRGQDVPVEAVIVDA